MFRAIENYSLTVPKLQESAFTRITEALLPGGGSYLEVTIQAIHEGLTRNYTNYGKDQLTHHEKNDQGHPGGLESWTKPYQAPILRDHNASADNVLGRVTKAEWVEKAGKDKAHVAITAAVTEPDAIQKFLRGEYHTGSIGMDVDSANCSVCDENLKDSPWGAYGHAHERGKWYVKAPKGAENEGQWDAVKSGTKGAKLAFVNVGNVWAHEYSMVATPSDAHSRVTSAQIKELTLKAEGHESINLLSSSYLQESALPTGELPNVDAQGHLIEAVAIAPPTPALTEMSVAEIHQALRAELDADLVGAYFRLASFAAALEAGFPDLACTLGDHALGAAELAKFLAHLEADNEELELELSAQRETVLSTVTSLGLPDSAFALVKTRGESTLRALPYRTSEGGTVNPDALLVSLSRVAGIPTFSAPERARATKKLIAAGRKAAVATPSAPDERVAAARELVVGLNYQVITEDSLAQLTNSTDVAELRTQLAEAQAELVQRDAESDALVEAVADLNAKFESSVADQRKLLIESIISLEAQDDGHEWLTELAHVSINDLGSKLSALSANRIIITAPAERRGLAGNDELPSPERPQIAAETAISSWFGSPRAQRQVAAALRHK